MIEPVFLKTLHWVGSSRKDFCAMPRSVRSELGFALYVAQRGGKHDASKPLRGFDGAGVVEIVNDHRGDTFRCVYTVRVAGSVYVLHAFQKKSKRGIKTPKTDMDLIDKRLREVLARAKTQKESGDE